MSLKNKLKEQAIKSLATSSTEQSSEPTLMSLKPIDKITRNIKAQLQELEEIKEFVFEKRKQVAIIREEIITSLIYVRDHKKELLTTTFEEYIEKEIGITKGYFYEQVQAYELCQFYNVPQYFSEVDYKILVYIARIKDLEKQKMLVQKATTLSREGLKKVSRTDKDKKKEVVYNLKDHLLLIKVDGITEKEILSFLGEKYFISRDTLLS